MFACIVYFLTIGFSVLPADAHNTAVSVSPRSAYLRPPFEWNASGFEGLCLFVSLPPSDTETLYRRARCAWLLSPRSLEGGLNKIQNLWKSGTGSLARRAACLRTQIGELSSRRRGRPYKPRGRRSPIAAARTPTTARPMTMGIYVRARDRT